MYLQRDCPLEKKRIVSNTFEWNQGYFFLSMENKSTQIPKHIYGLYIVSSNWWPVRILKIINRANINFPYFRWDTFNSAI